MPDPIPADIQELIGLCKAGKLFAVQEWIAAGRPWELPPGRYRTSPLRTAIKLGFHSLVEVFLRAGLRQEEKDNAIWDAMRQRRTDMVDLLAAYGADYGKVSPIHVVQARDQMLTRWFIEHGMDLEEKYPIAVAFRNGCREFLRLYMEVRDEVPSARTQASMALRYHCREGRMRWVALLLWAGADPREQVLDVDRPDDTESRMSALEQAASCCHVAIVKKFGIDPHRDDPTALLGWCWHCGSSALVEIFLEAGADPNGGDEDHNPMINMMHGLEWRVEGKLRGSIVECTNEQLVVSFSDDGVGIPKRNMTQLFEVGFSTTDGSGLGLHHIKEIMTEMGGEINAVTGRKQGAEFILTFRKR